MKQTGFKSNSDLLEGNKLYIKRAKLAFPILVRQAKAGVPIFYSDLAAEMGMSNPRNLNYILGTVGNSLDTLADRAKVDKIPYINCLVINKTDKMPGEGINWFIDKKNFDRLTKSMKREAVDRLLTEIYAYPDWDWVLGQLGLEPLKSDYSKMFKSILLKNKSRHGIGESQQHLEFKNYLAKHSELFGLKSNIIGVTEYEFLSSDRIDVKFDYKSEVVGVEAKSIISNVDDIIRGLFQCVKYKALIEAEQKANDMTPNCSVYLALEGIFPKTLLGLKNLLEINVIDKIKK